MAPEPAEAELAAIPSAEVFGYSRFMAHDEAATVRTLTDYRQQVDLLPFGSLGRIVPCMPRTSPRLARPWGSFGSMIAAGIVVVIAHDLLVWQLPSFSVGGVLLFVPIGLGLGVFGLLRRPSWQLRAGLVATLVMAAIVLNFFWFRAIDRVNPGYSFRRQEDDLLSTRYHKHDHWIPRQKSAYFVMADLLRGKQIRYIEGAQLSKGRLAALAEPSEIVDVALPEYPLPAAQQLWNTYPNRKFRLYSPDWAGERRLYRMVGITQGAEEAEYFVVLEIDGVDFVIPDSVWEEIGRRRGPRGPS